MQSSTTTAQTLSYVQSKPSSAVSSTSAPLQTNQTPCSAPISRQPVPRAGMLHRPTSTPFSNAQSNRWDWNVTISTAVTSQATPSGPAAPWPFISTTSTHEQYNSWDDGPQTPFSSTSTNKLLPSARTSQHSCHPTLPTITSASTHVSAPSVPNRSVYCLLL